MRHNQLMMAVKSPKITILRGPGSLYNLFTGTHGLAYVPPSRVGGQKRRLEKCRHLGVWEALAFWAFIYGRIPGFGANVFKAFTVGPLTYHLSSST